MELLKTATDWAKAEVFSTKYFIMFGILFILATIGFWQLGKSELAKAYMIPTLVAGVLLMTIGVGLLYTNLSRVKVFEVDYYQDATAFFQSEMERVDSTLKEYEVVFKVIPAIIIIAALLIMFIHTPTWRAISITTIAMMTVIMLIDGMAHARIKTYRQELDALEKAELID